MGRTISTTRFALFCFILLYYAILSNTSSIVIKKLTFDLASTKCEFYLSPLIHLPQPLLLRSNPQYLLQIPSHSLNISIHLFYCSCPVTCLNLPYYKAWYESCPECEYLLHTEAGKHFEYRNYYDSYFKPLMEQLGINRTPHCCRHTCISMLAEAGINQTIIKKIAGHSGAMTLTEKVYTHFDIKELVDAINKI